MKKIVALIMALALILTATAALASPSYDWQSLQWNKDQKAYEWVSPANAPAINLDGMLITPVYENGKLKSSTVHAYKNWVANLEDGTHSCDGLTVACDFEYFTLDGVAMYVCPVCGNLNGETVVPEVKSSYLQINRIEPKVKPTNKDIKWNTNGLYIVRCMAMPEDSAAAYIITACHEVAGVRKPAETIYNYTIPVDGRNLTLKQAYFGGLTDFAGTTACNANGFHIDPSKQSSSFGAFLLMK